MLQNLNIMRLTSACLSIVIKQGTKCLACQEVVSDVCEHSIGSVVFKETVYSRDIRFWSLVCCHEAGHRCTERLKV